VHVCLALAAEERRDVAERAVAPKGDWHVGALYREYHELLGGATCDEEHWAQDTPTACLACRPQQLLRLMVAGDEALRAASTRITELAIAGIHATQERIGTTYDAELRESLSLPTAYDAIEAALRDGVLRRRADGSVCADIENAGDAELTLLRKDGTALVFAMLLGIYLDRTARYPGWQTIELTGEHWRAGRLAMYEVLRRVGRGDISERTEGAFFGMVKRGGSVMASRSGSVVLADELLDRFADRVTETDDPEVRERLGVALLKYAVLAVPRLAPIDFDEDALWEVAVTGLGRVRRALALADGPGEPGRVAAPRARRDLALALMREDATVWRAFEERDPSVLVRYVDGLCEQAYPVLVAADDPLRPVFARVVRRALRLLAVELPAPAADGLDVGPEYAATGPR
jgi:arginyl-tRNA synthetase